MGEHGTWFDYLHQIPAWNDLWLSAKHALGRGWEWQMFGKSHFTLTHVLVTLLVIGIVVWGASRFFAGTKTADKGMVPPKNLGGRNLFEMLAESVYSMVEGAMGEHNAKRFFPLIGTLWCFILFGNFIGLVPGFVSSNDTLKTNLMLGLVVFCLTHYYGVKEHGLAYFKHFLGPIPALAPLMLPIELIGHIARPVSLALRLMGNMIADHKVVFAFFSLVPVLVPVPFLILGALVCLVQAIVFCTLTMVYLEMAVAHEDH